MEKQNLSLDEAIAMIPIGKFQYRLLLLCGLAFMTDSLEISLLSFIATCSGDQWNLSNAEIASIASVVFVGILIGSFFWGKIAGRYGRKNAFLGACSTMTLAGFLSGASPSYYWLIFFRTVVGFGVGGAVIPFDLLAEFIPAHDRGVFLIYIEYFWSLGSLFVAGVAWASLGSEGWRFLAYVSAIPVSLASILGILFLPESPRWLLVKGRIEEAEKIIYTAAEINGTKIPNFSLTTVGTDEIERDSKYIDLLRISKNRKVSLPLWTIWFMFGFTYYGLVLFVSRLNSNLTDEDDDDDKSCHFDYSSIFVNATAEVAGVLMTTFLIDRVGRRGSQSGFYAFGGLAVLIMGFNMPLAGVTSISFIGRLAAMSSSIVTWVVTPELYTTEVRTMGHSVGASWSKLGAFLAAYLVVSDISDFGLGFTLAIMNLIAALAALCLPETAGKQMEDLNVMDQGGPTLFSTLEDRDTINKIHVFDIEPVVADDSI